MGKVLAKLSTVVAKVAAEYAKDEADETVSYPYSPARATTALAKRYGYPRSRLVGPVAAVYYRENGSRAPLPKSAARSRRALALAVAKRRDAGGRLGRWEVVAESASATLGRPVSVTAVRALYREAGGDETRSYTGKGTRAGAVATRTDETAELASATETGA